MDFHLIQVRENEHWSAKIQFVSRLGFSHDQHTHTTPRIVEHSYVNYILYYATGIEIQFDKRRQTTVR